MISVPVAHRLAYSERNKLFIGSIMFSMAIGGFVDKVAQQVNLQLSIEQRAELILLIEDDALPTEAIEGVPQWVPNIEQLAKESFVGGFQIAIGALAGALLVALLLASFIPKISVDDVKSEEVREAIADVSSRRV